MGRWFCIGFIDFMLKGKSLLEHTGLLSPDDKWKKWQNNFKIYSINKKMKN